RQKTKSARSSRQFSRFCHTKNPDKVFGTHPVALAMQVVRKDLSITSLAELEAAAILTVSLLRAFFDRRINPAAKMSYPWERPRPGEEALCGKRLWPCSHWQRSA